MKAALIAYAMTALTLFGCDAVWLTFAGPRLYRPYLAPLLLDDFKVVPAALFYLIYVAAVVGLVVLPGRRTGAVAARGALLGLAAYATYDLTNAATLKDWPVIVTVVDLCWGTVLTAAAATVGFLVTRAATRAG